MLVTPDPAADATDCRSDDASLPQALGYLNALRLGFFLTLLLPTAWLHGHHAHPLPTSVIVAFVVYALASARHLAQGRLDAVDAGATSHRWTAIYLAGDLLAAASLLYGYGGGANPFISLLLLPVIAAAVLLPPRLSWLLTAWSIALYTLLMHWHRPLPAALHGHDDGFSVHLWGMWGVFVATALLIAWGVQSLQQALLRSERAVAQLREQSLQDEQMVVLGIFAAGVAHELSTPLSTIAVLSHDWIDSPAPTADLAAELAADMAIIAAQTDLCCQQLQQLRDGQRWGAQYPTALPALLAEMQQRWRLLRPQTPLHVVLDPPAVCIPRAALLGQTLLSLLNNAADASPHGITLSGGCESRRLVLEIRDEGAGLSPTIAAQLGKAPCSTKESGLGIGVLLARSAIQRLGGQLRFYALPSQPLRTRIELPLPSEIAPI